MSAKPVSGSTRARRPVRLVTYAWGRKYIDDLLTLTLPGVLAPGNLPALADAFPCEFVLLTQRAHFDHIRASASFRRLEATCAAQLVPIDDLVATTSAYGHSLTWTLFRSFEDLGDSVTETNLLFFNADWIPADGSYRSLIAPLEAGSRLIVAPSYCVREEAVIPLLRSRMASDPTALSIAPREMAEIAIRHRHNTVRGKTVNQNLFHMNVMDQFYYLVDEGTMLCRQMPIAIVCMRPERIISEPKTFWDYGTVSELCPATVPVVLGDSDDFLMIELRGQATYSEGLAFGPARRADLAEQLASFTTKDHRDYGRHTLVLHSADLPPDYAQARALFDGYVDGILDGLPPPVGHQDHPYWVDMRQFFDTVRTGHARWLSEARSTATTAIPDELMLANDAVRAIGEACKHNLQEFFLGAPFEDARAIEDRRQAWRDKHSILQRLIGEAGHATSMIHAMQEGAVGDLKGNIVRAVAAISETERLIAVQMASAGTARGPFSDIAGLLERIGAGYFDWQMGSASTRVAAPSETNLAAIAVNTIKDSIRGVLRVFLSDVPREDALAMEVARKAAGRSLAELQRLVSEAGHTANIIQAKQERALGQLNLSLQQTVAAMTHAELLVGSAKPGLTPGYTFSESTPAIRWHYQYKLVSMLFSALNPINLAMRPLRHLLSAFGNRSDHDILTVHGNQGGLAQGIVARLPGRHFSIHVDVLASMPMGDAPPKSAKFDLCVCDFSPDDAARFGGVYDRVAPYIRAGGKVILSAVNQRAGLRPFASSVKPSQLVAGCFPEADRVDVYYTGNYPMAVAIGFSYGMQAACRRLGFPMPLALLRIIGSPLSLFANACEQFRGLRTGGTPPRPWVGLVVCVTK